MYKYKSVLKFILVVILCSSLACVIYNKPSPGLQPKESMPAWNLDLINLGHSWDITQGNPDIRVAIIGWGIDTEHPQLKDNIVAAWDFVNQSPNIEDVNGHDTFAAGIVLSIAPEVSLITARVLDPEGNDIGQLDRAIAFAAEQGAHIILMPITILTPEPSDHYADAVQSQIMASYSQQVKMFIGAQGRGRHHSHRFPGYLRGVYNIAGVNRQGSHSLNSTNNDLNFISAPCDNIPGIETQGDWTNFSGTSWSSAHAAGVVALMLSVNPFLNNVEIEEILISTAQDKGVFGRDIYYGWGLIDCYQSVKKAKGIIYLDIITDSLNYQYHPYNNDLGHILKW